MSANLIATRYAKALMKVAAGNDEVLTKIGDFLKESRRLFDSSEIKTVLKSQVVPGDVKQEILFYVARTCQSGDVCERFISELVGAGRVDLIPEIESVFREQVESLKGLAHADVFVAAPLAANEQTDLEASLAKVFSKKLIVSTKVDPTILGGFIARVGNKSLDLSVKSRLENLAHASES